VIEPESNGVSVPAAAKLHVIVEDTSKRLDKVPAKVRVIVTRRPKYACRSCEKTGADTVAGVIQAPAPARLIEGGLPTEAMVADVVVSKARRSSSVVSANRRSLARHGVKIERSTLASMGRRRGCRTAASARSSDRSAQGVTAAVLATRPAVRCSIRALGKDQDRIPVALARDDRPWGGGVDAAVACGAPGKWSAGGGLYSYAPGRGGEHAAKLLDGFNGILQVDGYAAYRAGRADTAWWAGDACLLLEHLRRQVLRGLCRRQRADRDQGTGTHQAALRHRGGGPWLAAQKSGARTAAAVKTRHRSALSRGSRIYRQDVKGQQLAEASPTASPLGRLVPLSSTMAVSEIDSNTVERSIAVWP